MSRKDTEDLIKQLQTAVKAADVGEPVLVERALFGAALEGLQRLEQALDNRPSLIKKLNEKITKLEGELEILRNETRVNELERKVQRLEGELQRSYATKNFTLKNGLLEIEKAYRDFIGGSPAVQSLWDEITLLLVEDKESLPQHILARRHQYLNTSLTRGGAPGTEAEPAGAAGADTPRPDPSQQPSSDLTGLLPPSCSFVQQQVDKFKDYSLTPGPHDSHDGSLPVLHPHFHPTAHHVSSAGTTPSSPPGAHPLLAAHPPHHPDVRAVVDDQPQGLLTDHLTALRNQYDEAQARGGTGAGTGGGAVVGAPHWGSLVPVPSPLRPVSLFGGSNDDKPPDAAYLDSCRDELASSLQQLRALFATYDWAPTAPGGLPRPAAAGATPGAAAVPRPSGSQGDTAASFSNLADALAGSVERLKEYFGRMRWAPTAATGGADSRGATPSAAAAPDARYFDAQAEVILASVQRLRQQFQDAAAAAAAEAAAAAAAAAASGSSPSAWEGSGGGSSSATASGAGTTKNGVMPDARYFETQAEAIAASVDALLRLYERSSSGAGAQDPASGGGGHSLTSWRGTPPLPAPPTGGRSPAPGALTPDARAGEAVDEQTDAAVQPLIDLFSSFMRHLRAKQGAAAAVGGGRGPAWALSEGEGLLSGAAESSRSPTDQRGMESVSGDGGIHGDEGALDVAAGMPLNELVTLFAQYARCWKHDGGTAVAAAAGGGSRHGAGSPAGVVPSPSVGGRVLFEDASGSGPTAAAYGGGARLLTKREDSGDGPRGLAPAVRLHLSVTSAGTISARLSPRGESHSSPSSGAVLSVGKVRTTGGGQDDGHEADVTSAVARLDGTWAATPLAGSASAATGAVVSRLAVSPLQPEAAPLIMTVTTGMQAFDEAGDAAVPLSSLAAVGVSGAASAVAGSTRTVAVGSPVPRGPSPTAVGVLLSSLESRHGKALAANPEAVAVWRDLLRLLGVDPNSRPLPTAGSANDDVVRSSHGREEPAAAGPTMEGEARKEDGSPEVSVEDYYWARNEGPGGGRAGEDSGGEAAGQRARKGANASVPYAEASAAAAAMHDVAVAGEDAEGVGAVERGNKGSDDFVADAVVRQADNGRDGTGLRAAGAPQASERATGSAASGHDTSTVLHDEASLKPWTIGGANSSRAMDEGQAAAAATSATHDEADVGPNPARTDTACLITASQEQSLTPGAIRALTSSTTGSVSDRPSLTGADDTETYGSGAGGGEPIVDTTAAAAPAAATVVDDDYHVNNSRLRSHSSGGPGLVAGGVRFQITLSEITHVTSTTAAENGLEDGGAFSTSPQQLGSSSPRQQQQQSLVQFKANVMSSVPANGQEVKTLTAELEALQKDRDALTEALASTQELVLHLNRQLKMVLEGRDDLAARAERLAADLARSQSEVAEARNESDVFMRDLVDTKVQLAEVQGEYMQVYQALKKALGNEKGMMAKIDELERILAVVGPGDVSLDEEYSSAVGQVSATATPHLTPREDYYLGESSPGMPGSSERGSAVQAGHKRSVGEAALSGWSGGLARGSRGASSGGRSGASSRGSGGGMARSPGAGARDAPGGHAGY